MAFRVQILAISIALATVGCHQTPCGTCTNGTICDLDGTCRALGPRQGLGFARAARLRAIDWAATRRDRRHEIARPFDELLLGGRVDGVVHFAFDLPEGQIVGAILTVFPAVRTHPGANQTLRAFRTSDFDGRRVSRGVPPRRIGRFGTWRSLPGQVDRPVRLDVTELVQREPTGRVHLAIDARNPDGAPWRIASPTAEDDSRHPHLDLRLR